MNINLQDNINKTKRLRLLLIIVTSISFILFAIYFLFTFYHKSLKNVEEKELKFLKGISQTLAVLIDGDEHEYLVSKYLTKDDIKNNEDDSVYLKLNSILKKVHDQNNLNTDIYTLVLDKDASSTNLTNATFFVVTSSNPYFRHSYTPSIIFFDNYEIGGIVPPYGDDHGTWLSAFSPIHNSKGEIVAAVQVDLKFDDYINNARSTSFRLVAITGIIALLIIILIILLIISISNQLLNEQRSLADNFSALDSTYNNVTDFLNKIAQGDMSTEFINQNENDALSDSLIGLRNSLIKAEEDSSHRKREEDKQNWSTQGLALFGDILRENTEELENLSFLIISNLVKHFNANQGGMYVLNGESELELENDEIYFEQTAAYAYDRRKYSDKKIPINEGLIGMAAKEKKTIYMTDIPTDYLKITSGLGKANPKSLLIVPLKINEEIFGMIEIASFNDIEKYQIDFAERIAESIATTLKSTKTKIRTEKLLVESREMTQQLQEQEEELRQNTEEMLATQEEMTAYQAQLNSKFEGLAIITPIFELNENFKFISINKTAEELIHTNKKLLNQALSIFDRSKQDESFYNSIFSKLKEDDYWEGDILFGGSSSFKVKISVVKNEITEQITYIGTLLN